MNGFHHIPSKEKNLKLSLLTPYSGGSIRDFLSKGSASPPAVPGLKSCSMRFADVLTINRGFFHMGIWQG